MPTFGSLFAGIGGIDLGLERAGWTGRWQVEYEPFCTRVLARHWPDVTRYGDIHDVDWSGVERVDLVAGGFPCQPVSAAGRQKAQADERWLWPEFHRCIRALRPRYVLVENVTNLLAIGDGSAFGDVLGDLAASGYDAEWDCIPAAAVGALHERDRVWLVAYPRRGSVRPDGERRESPSPSGAAESEAPERERGGNATGRGRAGADSQGQRRRARWTRRPDPGNPGESELALHIVDDADGRRPQAIGTGRDGDDAPLRSGRASTRHVQAPAVAGRRAGMADANGARLEGRVFDRQRPGERPSRSGGLTDPGDWLTEPDVGRVAHGVPARVDRLRSLGNAVVPQVVECIGRRILEVENEVTL